MRKFIAFPMADDPVCKSTSSELDPREHLEFLLDPTNMTQKSTAYRPGALAIYNVNLTEFPLPPKIQSYLDTLNEPGKEQQHPQILKEVSQALAPHLKAMAKNANIEESDPRWMQCVRTEARGDIQPYLVQLHRQDNGHQTLTELCHLIFNA